MEFIWLIIVVLYIVFVAMSQAQKKTEDKGQQQQPKPWEVDDELEEAEMDEHPWLGFEHPPAKTPRPVKRNVETKRRELSKPAQMPSRRRSPLWRGKADWKRAVVMSELLRPPRAFRPYRVLDRRR